MTLYNNNLGRIGEDIACEYLIHHDFKIIDRNFRSKFGEIDIIAQKGNTIFFIEVKTRSNLTKGMPYEAINNHKIHQLQKASTYFLMQNNYKNLKYTLSAFSIVLLSLNDYRLHFFESID